MAGTHDGSQRRPARPVAPAVGPATRLVYLGSPDAAVPPLRALVERGHEIALVVSQPDKRRGRGSAQSPSPVKAAALELGLPVTDRVDDVLDLDPPPDLGVVVAFGKIIKPHVLARVPMINLHFSLLPRWRGAAPVERAVLADDDETGVCVMEVEEGLDTGGVYRCEKVAIDPEETAAALRDRLVAIGTRLLVEALDEGLGRPEPQTGEPTYAAKIDPSELALDFSHPADELARVVRIGGAWTTHNGKRLKVHEAHVEDGHLVPDVVQPEGKASMPAADWARGAQWRPGDPLGT